jgi:hypothetical protein
LASSAFLFASNSSLLCCIARFIELVLEGFSTALSPPWEACLARLFWRAALNLSTGAWYYYSLRYWRSSVFELVLVKLGLFGLVTCICDFFLFSFWLNFYCAFSNCSLVTRPLIFGRKEQPSYSWRVFRDWFWDSYFIFS